MRMSFLQWLYEYLFLYYAAYTMRLNLAEGLRLLVMLTATTSSDHISASSLTCLSKAGNFHTKYCGNYLGPLGTPGNNAKVITKNCGKCMQSWLNSKCYYNA